MIQLHLYSSFSFLFIHVRGRHGCQRKDMMVRSKGSSGGARWRGNAAVAGSSGTVVASLGVCIHVINILYCNKDNHASSNLTGIYLTFSIPNKK
jgi:hypothetical protein